MKKFLGVIVAFIIFGVMMSISVVIKIARQSGLNESYANGVEPNFITSYVTICLQLAPLVIAIWLIKLSWKKITNEKSQHEK